MSYSLHMNGKTYDLVPSRINLRNEDGLYRRVWIIRIQDEAGQEITNARIFGTQDEADKAGSSWLNGLLRANPGSFMRFVTCESKDQY